MRRGSGINKGTDPEQSAKRVEAGRQGRRMRVQDISGKDVHNMKARSLIKRGPASSQQIQHLRGGTGVCAGGSSRTNGSGHALSVPAVAHPPPLSEVLGRGKGEPPKCPTRQPRVGGYK